MNSNNTNICLIGPGYVGLPLAVAFAEKFKVVGFDIDASELETLKTVLIKHLRLRVIY